jgi:hypothetical protein
MSRLSGHLGRAGLDRMDGWLEIQEFSASATTSFSVIWRSIVEIARQRLGSESYTIGMLQPENKR